MMTPADVEAVLAYAGSGDSRVRRRDPDERRLQVAFWHAQVGHLDIADARLAVTRHYAVDGVDALLPGRLRSLIVAIREERLRATVEPTPAADPDDPRAYLAELRAARRRIASPGYVPPPEPVRPALPPAELEARFGALMPSVPGRRRSGS